MATQSLRHHWSDGQLPADLAPQDAPQEGTLIGSAFENLLLHWVELSGLEPLTSCMPYPARLSETGAGLGGCRCRVHAGRSQAELVGGGRGCQAGARSWAVGILAVPGREVSLRVRPPDRCRSLAAEDQRQGWRLRHRVSDASVASALDGDLARRHDARREEDDPAPSWIRSPERTQCRLERFLVCKVRLCCRTTARLGVYLSRRHPK